MTDELKQKAENFIIDRYKLNECYREDNAETREYMRMDVHSQYEEEYQLYLDATKELEKKIEKMKCCQNCLHLCARCELGIEGCYVCSKWQLRR